MSNELYNSVLDLRTRVQKEWMQCEEVKQSQDYQTLERRIESLLSEVNGLKAEQQAMLDEVPNSRGALEEAKKALYEAMLAEGRDVMGEAKLKYSKSRSVDKERLLILLDGDLERFYGFANVTLKSVEEAAKADQNFRLLDCIETVSTPAGVDFPS